MEVMEFDGWYRTYHPVLVAALTVVAGNGSAGRDAADEALVRAYERWHRVAVMTSPEAWTYTVGVNLVRRRARRASVEARLGIRTDRRPAAPPELRLDVWDAVRDLPPRQREAIALRYLLDLSETQVADVMGIAVGTASATLATARRALAVALDDDQISEVTE
jgi:RNA polymerase sigma-70 factor (ECF subfamily)